MGVFRHSRILSVLLVSLLAATTAFPSAVANEPYVASYQYQGHIPWAAAWHAEAPGMGCIIVEDTPSPLTPKSCGGIRGGGAVNGEVSTNVTEGVQTLIVELEWDDSTGGSLQLDTMCDEVPRGPGGAVLDPDHPCYKAETGSSPLRIRVDADDWAGGAYDPVGAWATRVFAAPGTLGSAEDGAGVGLAIEQSFLIHISVFYHAPAPEGWSALP